MREIARVQIEIEVTESLLYFSHEWKRELTNRKRNIKRNNSECAIARDYESAYHGIERDILYSALIIRKLAESSKLTDCAENYCLGVKLYRPLKNITRNKSFFDPQNYDMESPEYSKESGANICNWLIHSYALQLLEDETGKIGSFFVSSDRTRNKALYEVRIEDWIKYVEYIITDEIVGFCSLFDNKKNDYVTLSKF